MKTFKATVHKVHPLKLSRNRNSFIRIDFILEDGRFSKTDICPDYRNYSRWVRLIELGPGTVVGNLLIKSEVKLVEINADSYPEILRKAVSEIEKPKPAVTQETLL